ncbi:MAG: hypothetical protein Q9218_002932 [Villophora microphyllina]
MCFLTVLIKEVIRNPCPDTLRPVYKILLAVGPHLLDGSPSQVVAGIQEQFKVIIRNVGPEDLSATNLFCFAVVALLSSSPAPILAGEQGPTTSSVTLSTGAGGHSDIRQWAHNLFASKRALKTLDIAVFTCINAFSKSYSLDKSELVEWLNLSNTIITAVDDEARGLWLAKDRSKIKKLVEKVSSYKDSQGVLCAALQVIASLTDGSSLPQELMRIYKAVFCVPTASSLSDALGAKIAILLDETSIQELLLSLLGIASDEVGSKSGLSDIDASLVLTESLSRSIEDSPSMRQKILYLLSTDALAAPLERYLDVCRYNPSAGVSDNHWDTCPYLRAQKQTMLRQQICTLALKTSIFAQQDESSLDASLGLALLDIKAIQDVGPFVCRKYSSNNQPRKPYRVGLLESESTPDSRIDSRQWRDSIIEILAQNAQHQHHTIVRTMGEICQDLERRCNEVERPLRDEEARSTRLRLDLQESKARVEALESHKYEQSMIMEGIEHEKSELAARVLELEGVQEELSDTLAASRQELNDTARQAADDVRSRADEASEHELIHTAAIAQKDEALEAQLRNEQALRARVEDLTSELISMRQRESVAVEEGQRLEAKVVEQATALEKADASIGDRQQRLEQQNHVLDDVRAENSELKLQITTLSDTCDALKADLAGHAATIESQLMEIDRLRCDYESQLSTQSAKLNELVQSAEERTQQLQVLVDEQTGNATRLSHEHHSKIRHLERKLTKANKALESHKNELAEAREVYNQAAAFWSKPRGRQAVVEESPTSPIASPASDFASCRSSKIDEPRRTSPEPKRSKTQRRLGLSRCADDAGRLSNSTEILTSVGKTKSIRQPLGELLTMNSAGGGTLTRTTSKPRPKEELCKENVDFEMVDASSYNSDFFTSTDEQLVANLHGKSLQPGHDDTTVEF